MFELQQPYRQAGPADARAMAELVNIAGEGLPLYLWAKLAEPGESVWDVGEQRAQREAGSFSFGNTVLRDEDDKVAAALVSYAIEHEPEPVDYNELPAMFVPLQKLEDLVPGTWYVNVLAAYEEYRGRGFGSGLLAVAEQLADAAGYRAMSIIVANENRGARRLYERTGYVEVDRRAIVKEDWESPSDTWVLMRKDL